ETTLLASFTSWRHVVIGACAIGLLVAVPKVSRRRLVQMSALGLVLGTLGMTRTLPVADALSPYRYDGSFFWSSIQMLELDAAEPYGDAMKEEAARYWMAREAFELGAPPRNIVLVVIESLSSVDSTAAGGSNSKFPKLDGLASEAHTFENFFANHSYSAGGLISLVQGVPPLPFPNALRSVSRSYAKVGSPFNARGAKNTRAEVLLSFDKGMLRFDEWARELGLDAVRGLHEVALFQDQPRFALDGISDQVLYQQALSDIARLGSSSDSFFLMVVTSSSHRPYLHPAGGANTEDEVFRYVDTAFHDFYQALKADGFFANGYLLVTGDHRKLMPLTPEELTRWGDSAQARVPLFIFGPDVVKGTRDKRFFQQSDLLRKLDTAITGDTPLSPHPIFVSEWISFAKDADRQGNLLVFNERESSAKKGAVLSAHGRTVRTLEGEVPEDVLREIHMLRARAQDANERKEFDCVLPQLALQTVTAEHFRETLYWGNVLGSREANPIHETTVPAVAFDRIRLDPTSMTEGATRVYQTVVQVEESGYYWLRLIVDRDAQACLRLGDVALLSSEQALSDADTQGIRRLDARVYLRHDRPQLLAIGHYQSKASSNLKLYWRVPGEERFEPFKQIPGK
ncbi:MAG: sulfatase-like hydrolase/transferase, partial [Bdellovibrionales bacterium]|nr:sulfatase-like hydrolase/transferase [Bdellovibrionales bacterium]